MRHNIRHTREKTGSKTIFNDNNLTSLSTIKQFIEHENPCPIFIKFGHHIFPGAVFIQFGRHMTSLRLFKMNWLYYSGQVVRFIRFTRD